MSIRVAIADDHPALLAGMEQVLEGMRDVQIVALAADSAELVNALDRHPVDVVVTDFSMPRGRHGDGIALLRFLQRRFPRIRLVLLTSMENADLLRIVEQIGVSALVSKADDPHYLEEAVRAAFLGSAYATPHIRQVLDRAGAATLVKTGRKLSKREGEVLRLFAEGLSAEEIGARLHRSPKTVGCQKRSAMKKLGLTSNAEIFEYAMRHGLVQSSTASRLEQDDVSGQRQDDG